MRSCGSRSVAPDDRVRRIAPSPRSTVTATSRALALVNVICITRTARSGLSCAGYFGSSARTSRRASARPIVSSSRPRRVRRYCPCWRQTNPRLSSERSAAKTQPSRARRANAFGCGYLVTSISNRASDIPQGSEVTLSAPASGVIREHWPSRRSLRDRRRRELDRRGDELRCWNAVLGPASTPG